MRPVIFFVDDEPRNLTVFEATVPEEWDIHLYDSAVTALKDLKSFQPWLIVSDQKMPQMTGLEFLEIASGIVPEAIRIVVTGQTEENTIIEMIRRAKIYDFLTKPWESEHLISQLEKSIDHYRIIVERNEANARLLHQKEELEKSNQQLSALTEKLRESNRTEARLRQEISAWVPSPIVQSIEDSSLSFPLKKDFVGVTYDIVSSSQITELVIQNSSIRSHVIQIFTQCLLKNGGIAESWSGDSMYGHFGAFGMELDMFTAALSATQDFRVQLRGFSQNHDIELECGIALHYIQNALIQLHEVKVDTAKGVVIQKSFNTESAEIDLLHRVEKLLHHLPGSNVALTGDFVANLPTLPAHFIDLGKLQTSTMKKALKIFLIPSDRIKDNDIKIFKEKLEALSKEEVDKAA